MIMKLTAKLYQPPYDNRKQAFRRSIGVRIMEETEIIEGEVVEVQVRFLLTWKFDSICLYVCMYVDVCG